MAEISNYVFVRHVRAESSNYLLKFSRGRLQKSGRGLAFWFMPLSSSIAEVPVDDQELSLMFHCHSADFQEVHVQGVVSYRVNAPKTLAERIDFSIDLGSGRYLKQPIEQLAGLLTELAQQLAHAYIGKTRIATLLGEGQERVRELVEEGLRADDALTALGVELVSTRISAVRPNAVVEKALEIPARESIQQQADEARFQRRAMAVEKERAIRENELQSEIELARRQESLIEQQGQNERRRMAEEAEAKRIEAEAAAERCKLEARAQADAIESVESAKVAQERERIGIYRDLPASVMAGLAARELAGKLHTIEHLNVSPELLGPSLLRLMRAGSDRLEE